MDDIKRPKEADWAPGTLDRTRRAIGDIDPLEAEVMSKKLGGEIMYEKSSSNSTAKPSTKGTGRIVRSSGSSAGASSGSAGSSNSGDSGSSSGSSAGKGRKKQEELININPKFSQQIDKIMMSDEYGIKPNYGLFNFIKYFQQNGHEQIIPEFGGADRKTTQAIAGYMKEYIKIFLEKYSGKSGEEIAQERYDRFRVY